MKRKSYILIIIMLIIGALIGCNSNPQEKNNSNKLQQVEEIQGFTSINGYKVQESRFLFTAVKKNEWNILSLDLESGNINSVHQDVEKYDLYIAIGETGAVYIDLEGQLFHRMEGKERKIDENVVGVHRPNLLLSPKQNAVLYTKGAGKEADVYVYFFQQEKPMLIKENIPEDAFANFSFTTQWSNKKNYFIYNNEEVYNDKGELYDTIEATSAQWSPMDQHIVFIKKPDDLQQKEIMIGNWSTYIGEELVLLNIEKKKEEIIYESPMGLIDPIDSIQWSKDGSKVGVSVGEITKAPHGELERVNYEKVFVYDVSTKEGVEMEEMPYNYYEILFDNYLYGSSLGRRDVLEIAAIYHEDRKKYETPVLLNSKDMFVISYEEEGYFLDGNNLIKITSEGKTEFLIELPWEVNEIYLEPKTKTFIITNRDMELYLLKQ
ncbi:hypothetical protein SAMN05446037_10218 [Anaerovirgula multivorans]|uniref:Uncharacterized protein n=1 Tax=Anaerovirgula multivorans TaxID=312168 RepID=A0A239HAX2_9FIRM|nr:hypothetical protein [Anaerovirgula multivorans]SNS78527.1 hypothetical protein SAMN05446037_10218 [Anaerovirgula multivorans]